jgi:hypothetical protein
MIEKKFKDKYKGKVKPFKLGIILPKAHKSDLIAMKIVENEILKESKKYSMLADSYCYHVLLVDKKGFTNSKDICMDRGIVSFIEYITPIGMKNIKFYLDKIIENKVLIYKEKDDRIKVKK